MERDLCRHLGEDFVQVDVIEGEREEVVGGVIAMITFTKTITMKRPFGFKVVIGIFTILHPPPLSGPSGWWWPCSLQEALQEGDSYDENKMCGGFRGALEAVGNA